MPASVPLSTDRTDRPGSARSASRLRRPVQAPLAAASLAAGLALALSGCASLLPADRSPSAAGTAPAGAAATPPRWQAALPHGGQTTNLRAWWQQFDDPLLVDLIDSAQSSSPSISAARSRFEQARATRTGADSALLPGVTASASAARGKQQLGAATGWLLQSGVQASWEFDLFGGNRAAASAAATRLDGAAASWHDARVSVAAEVANTYLQLRTCEAQRAQAEADATSRAETSRLTDLSERAGFQAPSAAALARASAAQGRAVLTAQRAACDTLVKALVALTARPEPDLRTALSARTARLPVPKDIGLAQLPADVLSQRPDVRAAEADWIAAAADVQQTDAARLPRISLAGNLTGQWARTADITARGTTWAIGPVTVTLPIFDAGVRAAQSAAARARLADAQIQLQGRLRQAVREVEEALVQLHSTAARNDDAVIAAQGFEASLRAADARQKGGLASLFELEDARRTAVAANSALIDLQRDRVAAWVALYRAAGGGWQRGEHVTAAVAPNNPPRSP